MNSATMVELHGGPQDGRMLLRKAIDEGATAVVVIRNIGTYADLYVLEDGVWKFRASQKVEEVEGGGAPGGTPT